MRTRIVINGEELLVSQGDRLIADGRSVKWEDAISESIERLAAKTKVSEVTEKDWKVSPSAVMELTDRIAKLEGAKDELLELTEILFKEFMKDKPKGEPYHFPVVGLLRKFMVN